ncbi:KpsF/GutQ family sugar-phosphate isomerase [Chlamydiifrater phoenicopteri]|uniref:KpsF/GutQ family sugar-phosphate isomerase n=1 Tax=Chlamydiifrater phoenicopteri TaxID=2681469 RepID=UPI001BCBEF31|nr:KpsF/GutQ family sugar-phosphate isomerase [Chlamydiifrater phoenicopteri]
MFESRGVECCYLVMKEVLSLQKLGMDVFFSSFDFNFALPLIEKILGSSGNIFFSGVGKSGFIARKIAATFQSFGERAFFLNAGDVLHGDLGVIREGDIVVLLSNSGETEELVKQVPYFQNKGCEVFVVTSGAYSRMAFLANSVIVLPSAKEIDAFNLAPTTSTQYQLLLGDFLAATIARVRKLSFEDYGNNHPAGTIGLRANVKVEDIMSPLSCVPTCTANCSVRDVLEIISLGGFGCVLILSSEGILEGIFTDGDLRRTLKEKEKDFLDLPITSVMTSNPRLVLGEASIHDALEDMEAGSPVTVLPVVDSLKTRRVVGLLHMHTLARQGLLL